MGGGGPAAPARPREVLDAVPGTVDVALSAVAGVTAAACMSPFILTIDRAVTEYAAGNSGLLTALRTGTMEFVRRPLRVVCSAPLVMVVGVYGATYAAANTINTVSERKEIPKTQHTVINLVGTTGINMASGVAKDAAFAKMFGAKADAAKAGKEAVKRAVPRATYGLFAARDLLTVGAAFTVPPIMASAIAANGVEPGRAAAYAQFASPPLMQVVCTPLHLLALDMYNVPKATIGERFANIGRLLPSSIGVRMFRFFCAYGVGGNMNMWLTQSHRQWSAGHYAPEAQGGASLPATPGTPGTPGTYDGTMSPYVTAHAVLDWEMVLGMNHHDVTEADIDRLFEKADLDGDGNLDESELVRILSASVGSDREKHSVALQMIRVGDFDKDGKVSKAELRALLLEKKTFTDVVALP